MQRIIRPLRTLQPLLLKTTTTTPKPNLSKPFLPKLRTMASAAPTTPSGAAPFLSALKSRRTYYALSKDLGDITPTRIQEIVSESLLHVPSSFNSQSNRVVVLFGAEHDKFWDITLEILKGIVPEAQFASTQTRISGFKAGAGTVLFFEDWTVVEGMQEKFAIYADRFGPWAGHSDAMLQFAIWTALEAEGLGANLQHYNPLVDAKVQEEWKVPASWKLQAQLVFGGKIGEAGEKSFGPLEEKLKVFGA
ncbi:Nitroreductase-like protein [Podospora fimiseda]|uniref:Nitroreductase-like protein n=1 Tax=Podospora fimiseda TaxID=252190 RepID=A0AAN7BPE6_9PEZI|nr:Nitroreductase-like protein [Podospora fimiseda]